MIDKVQEIHEFRYVSLLDFRGLLANSLIIIQLNILFHKYVKEENKIAKLTRLKTITKFWNQPIVSSKRNQKTF